MECVALFAALLSDLWLGNSGFTPGRAAFVVVHSSRCVSLHFATAAGLAVGVLTDLLYCRDSSGTPLWYMLALYSGQAALFRRDADGSGRAVLVVLTGAAVGGVLTLRWLLTGGEAGETYPGMALDLLFGAAGGVLKFALTVLLLDFVCGYLGVRGFFPYAGKPAASGGTRRRLRRVRAEKVAGKRA